jgi:hypothetical protein
VSAPAYRISNPYGRGRWFINAAMTVRFTLQENIAGVVAGKDISDSRWTVYLRASESSDPTNFLSWGSVALTKVTTTATAGDGGVVTGVMTPRERHDDIDMNLVLVDTSITDTATPSGKREYLWSAWKADVLPASTGA